MLSSKLLLLLNYHFT